MIALMNPGFPGSYDGRCGYFFLWIGFGIILPAIMLLCHKMKWLD